MKREYEEKGVETSTIEINPDFVSKTLIKFKEELDKSIENVGKTYSTKTTEERGEYLNPYVPVHLARYAYHNSSTLRSVIESFSQDVFLNEYSLEDPNEDPEIIEKSWNKSSNKYQLYLAGIERYLYGYGVLEFTSEAKKVKMVQIPAHTVKIRVIPFKNPETGTKYQYYYAEQDINGQKRLFEISYYDYSMLEKYGVDNEAVGKCLWLGGCNENEFFDIPRWTAKRKALFTDMAIDEFNSKKIEQGNLLAGFLMLTGPRERPDPREPEEKGVADKIEQELKGGNCGTIVSYIGNNSASKDVKMQYVTLQDNNWQYFEQIQENCVSDLLKCFKMPKVRLAIDDIKESMNSNKTDNLYEIYNREIKASQLAAQPMMDEFNRIYMDVKSDMVISTPEFSDKTSTRIENAVTLWNNGLLSLGQTIEVIAPIYPNIEFKEEGTYTEELWNTRFYKGQILGNTTEEYEKEEQVEGIIEEVNKMLREDNQKTLKI